MPVTKFGRLLLVEIYTEYVMDLDWRSEMIISTTFELSIIFGRSWGSIENWHEPITESTYANLAYPNPWNALYEEMFGRKSYLVVIREACDIVKAPSGSDRWLLTIYSRSSRSDIWLVEIRSEPWTRRLSNSASEYWFRLRRFEFWLNQTKNMHWIWKEYERRFLFQTVKTSTPFNLFSILSDFEFVSFCFIFERWRKFAWTCF